MKLGTLLLRNAAITLSQLETALRTQVISGGRLGTNLIELGFIDIGTLSEYLAESLSVPLATQSMFESVSQDVIDEFGADLAKRYTAFPLGYQGNRLAVAVVEPSDRTTLARLADDVGCAIVAHVAPELRIYYYLERHYQLTRKARYLRLGTDRPTPPEVADRRRTQPHRGISMPPPVRLQPRVVPPKPPRARTATDNAAEAPSVRTAEPATAEPAGSTAAPPPAVKTGKKPHKPAKAAPRPPSVSAASSGRKPRGKSKRAPTAIPKPRTDETSGKKGLATMTYREACAAIDRADHRDLIGDALVEYARGRFEVAVVFLLRDSNAVGWRAYNSVKDRATMPIDELSLPLGGASVLQVAHDEAKMYRGGAISAGKPTERKLWEALGTDEPADMLVVPIVVKRRVVNLIYVHGIAGALLNDTSAKKLSELAKRGARAYLRMIRDAKNATRKK